MSTTLSAIMSDSETKAILKSAQECAEGECSVDDVSELIFELKEQEHVLSKRLESIMNSISKLQHLNEKDGRQTDEVRAFVRDIMSVFKHDKPGAFKPSGFSGEIFKGKMTAFDVLPPKKWTP